MFSFWTTHKQRSLTHLFSLPFPNRGSCNVFVMFSSSKWGLQEKLTDLQDFCDGQISEQRDSPDSMEAGGSVLPETVEYLDLDQTVNHRSYYQLFTNHLSRFERQSVSSLKHHSPHKQKFLRIGYSLFLQYLIGKTSILTSMVVSPLCPLVIPCGQ